MIKSDEKLWKTVITEIVSIKSPLEEVTFLKIENRIVI